MRTFAILIAIASITLAFPTGSAGSETAASSNSSSGSICATSISNTIQCGQASIESTTTCAYDWYYTTRWYCDTDFQVTTNAQGLAFCARGRVYAPAGWVVADSGTVCPSLGAAAPTTGYGWYSDQVGYGGETLYFTGEICIWSYAQPVSCKWWTHSVYEPGPPAAVPDAGALVNYAVSTAVSALSIIP